MNIDIIGIPILETLIPQLRNSRKIEVIAVNDNQQGVRKIVLERIPQIVGFDALI